MTAVVPADLDVTDALLHTAVNPPAASAEGWRNRWPTRRIVRWATGIGLVALFAVEAVFLAPFLASAFDAMTEPNPWWLLLALVTEALSMGAFARVQRRMLQAAGQRVGIVRMVRLTYAANALSVTFPGGTALSSGYVFTRLRSWGATVPAAGFTVVASGVLSVVGFAVVAVIAGLVAGGGLVSSALTLVAVALAALAVLALRRPAARTAARRTGVRIVRRANRIAHRPSDAGLATVRRFVRDLGSIHPRQRDWAVALGLAVLNWAADLVCLYACCAAVGADRASIEIVTLAYVAGMSASSVSFLPGGFGVVDVAIVLALTASGVGTAAATAGAVLYRVISVLLVVAVGWVMWGTSWWADRRTSAEQSVAPADQTATASATV